MIVGKQEFCRGLVEILICGQRVKIRNYWLRGILSCRVGGSQNVCKFMDSSVKQKNVGQKAHKKKFDEQFFVSWF